MSRSKRRFIEYIGMALSLPTHLPRFLRGGQEPGSSCLAITQRHSRRAEAFLNQARRAIYANPHSPYLQLLHAAGVTLSELEATVHREGVERTLQRLADSGVYVTFDEFKGKTPARRGSHTFYFNEEQFDNPWLVPHYEAISGGTRGRGTRVRVSLRFMEDIAVNSAYAYQMHDLLGCEHAIWLPTAGAAPMAVFIYLKLRLSLQKWFSHWVSLPFKYRVGASYLRWLAMVSGQRIPPIEYVDLNNAGRIAKWMATILNQGKTPCLLTYASSALRICQIALDHGIPVEGSRFVVLGEPYTEAKRSVFLRAGATVVPRFAFTEAGIIGYGCLQPKEADDIHPFTDCFGIIRHRRNYRSEEVSPLPFTSLLPTSPKILLNVESGDTAEWDTNPCSCPLGAGPYPLRIRTIRSFEKFTGEGVSFAGADLLRILEVVLPNTFGGTATDYQLLEEEGEQGTVSLTLRVNPVVGPVDRRQVVDVFLRALSAGGDNHRRMALLWRQANNVRVVLAPPVPTVRGKLLPFHTRAISRREFLAEKRGDEQGMSIESS